MNKEGAAGGTKTASRRIDISISDDTIRYRTPPRQDQSGSNRVNQAGPRPSNRGMSSRTSSAARSSSYRHENSIGSSSKPKRKTRFATLFAIVIFAGVIISVAAFGLMISALNRDNLAAGTPVPTVPVTGVIPAASPDIKQTCLVKSSDASTKTFTLYSIMDGSTFYLSAAQSTEMTDTQGNHLVFAEFKQGDVVDVVYKENDSILLSIRQSSLAQTYPNITGLRVDPENSVIKYNNKDYIYGQELVCVKDGADADVTSISPVDRVTLRVYRNVAVFAEVTTGHGTINVVYNDLIKNGTIEIGKDIYSKLDSDRSFDMREGTQKVVVKGDNIELFQLDVPVVSGETVTVDLSNVQMRYGFLSFTSNQDDVYVTLDDQPVLISDVLSLEFGTYTVKATAFGFEPFEQTVDLTQAAQTVNINMELIPTPTPRPIIPETVRFEIKTNVAYAEVYIDGEYIGLTSDPDNPRDTPLSVPLELGVRSLRISKSGYTDYVSELVVTEEFKSSDNTFILQPEQRMPY